MGILNVTPDSFYDGGKFREKPDALRQVEKMLMEGATFIDVGGYSSRPGALDVPPEEEQQRVLPVIRAIAKEFPACLISIDTFRSEIAKAAISEGACMVNDVSGGEADKAMVTVVAALRVPYILMHTRGTPQTMAGLTGYNNLISDAAYFFSQKIHALQEAGVHDIVIDPGFGFAKTVQQNFELLQHLDYFNILDRPLLVGLSRKSMIWKTLAISPEQALNGSTALHTVAILKGASILRVHDVAEATQIIELLKQFG